MHLSIASSMYNNSSHVEEFIKKCVEVCFKLEIFDYEIIIVDDASQDDTYLKLHDISKNFKKLKIIRLYENCGQAFSLITAFKHANGDYIFTLDSDLDENPEELIKFYKLIKSKKLDLVYGYLVENREITIEKIFSKMYYFITSKLRNKNSIDKNKISCMRLFTNDVNKYFLQLKDQEIEILSFLKRFDLNTDGIQIVKEKNSKSQYTFNKKFEIFLNFIMNDLSQKFLNTIFSICLIIIFFILCLIAYYLIRFLFFDVKIGFTSTILSIWLIGLILIIFQLFIINFIIRIKKLLDSDKYDKIKNKINF
jgi:putative glycosyltransferase